MDAFVITLSLLAKASDSPLVVILLPFAVLLDVLLRLALSAVDVADGVNLTTIIIRLIASMALANRLDSVRQWGDV